MKTITLLVGIIFFAGTPANCQELENAIEKEDIHFHMSIQWNSSTPHATSTLTFNRLGDITFIYKAPLNPIAAESSKHYCTAYQYSKEGRLSEEILYEFFQDDITILRTTKYDYNGDTLSVITKSKENGKVLAEVIEFKHDDETERKYMLDELFGKKPSLLRNSTVNITYRNNELIKLIRTNYLATTKIKVSNQENKKIIAHQIMNDTLEASYLEFRFYDKYNRLIKICSEDNSNKWHTKLYYDKKGTISKIVRKGRMFDTGEKIKRTTFFENTTAIDLPTIVINKMNKEIIDMYFPVTGIGSYLNYYDSRKYMTL